MTVLGGGWVASGEAGLTRLPSPALPAGLSLIKTEGTGEVQTPLTGPVADTLRIGDRVWFRHAKAGELCEHVDDLRLIDGDQIIGGARHLSWRAERRSSNRPAGAVERSAQTCTCRCR